MVSRWLLCDRSREPLYQNCSICSGLTVKVLSLRAKYTSFWAHRVRLAVYYLVTWPWCRHQMETFSALLAICAGNSPVPGEFPTQRPVTRSFDVFFDLRLNKRLSKQSWGWWFKTLSRPLWRHSNDDVVIWTRSHYWPFVRGGGFPLTKGQ